MHHAPQRALPLVDHPPIDSVTRCMARCSTLLGVDPPRLAVLRSLCARSREEMPHARDASTRSIVFLDSRGYDYSCIRARSHEYVAVPVRSTVHLIAWGRK